MPVQETRGAFSFSPQTNLIFQYWVFHFGNNHMPMGFSGWTVQENAEDGPNRVQKRLHLSILLTPWPTFIYMTDGFFAEDNGDS